MGRLEEISANRGYGRGRGCRACTEPIIHSSSKNGPFYGQQWEKREVSFGSCQWEMIIPGMDFRVNRLSMVRASLVLE